MKKVILICSTVLWISLFAREASAQCPMCRVGAESNLKAGGKAGRGLNAGILYMLALPYALVGGIGYLWWRNRRQQESLDHDEEGV